VIAFQGPLLVALIIVAWLTASGMAVRSVSRIWLRHWAERRLRGSEAAMNYLERPQRLLAAAGTGVAVTLMFAGMIIGASDDTMRVVTNVIVYGAIVILLGQLVPRAIARRWPSALAPILLPVLQVTAAAMTPVANFGAWLARPWISRHAPERDTERDPIQDLLREGELEGIGERSEIAIISGVVEFSEKRVREVMTARADIFALPQAIDAHELGEQIARAGYSRVPIYRQTLDDADGMVHVFDVLKALGESFPPKRPLASATPVAPGTELLFRM
jgi:putative hemolysin